MAGGLYMRQGIGAWYSGEATTDWKAARDEADELARQSCSMLQSSSFIPLCGRQPTVLQPEASIKQGCLKQH